MNADEKRNWKSYELFDKKHFIRLSIFVLLCSLPALKGYTQSASLNFIQDEKEVYMPGDTVEFEIVVKISPEICPDGMKQTKVYLSGLSKIKETDWQQNAEGIWRKKLALKVVKNKKNKSKITIIRRADKGEFIIQKSLDVAG